MVDVVLMKRGAAVPLPSLAFAAGVLLGAPSVLPQFIALGGSCNNLNSGARFVEYTSGASHNGAETRWQLRLIHEGLPEYPYSYHVNTSLWFATQGGTIATYHFVEIGAWDGDWEGTGLYTGFYTIRGTGNSNYAEAKLTTPYTLGDVATFDVTYEYSDTVRAQVTDETTATLATSFGAARVGRMESGRLVKSGAVRVQPR